MSEEFRNRLIAFAVALGVALLAVGIDRILYATYAAQERRQTGELLTNQRTLLERRLNETLHLPVGLGALVLSGDQLDRAFDERDFIVFAKVLTENRPSIRGIQLAPNGQVKFVYPRAGNELAVGLNLFTHPASRVAARRARDSGTMVVEGPTPLVQGGTGLIARHPIFLASRARDAGRAEFWGFSTVLVDFSRLLEEANVRAIDGTLQLAIRGRDGLGAQGDVIFGDPAVFQSNPVLLPVSFSHGAWQLAGMPANGWSGTWPGRTGLAIGAALLALLFGVATWWMLDQARRLRVNERVFRGLALHDGLTGLRNRRGLDELLDREWNRCRRQSKPISVVMCDVDFFKQYNDALGHAAGDDCLRAVATAILGACGRATDVIARYGGEEFVMLLPEVDAAGAAHIAEVARQKVLGLSILHPASPYRRVSISAGVATMVPGENKFPGDLLAEADFWLYGAKQGGRNQIQARTMPEHAPAPSIERVSETPAVETVREPIVRH